jgi:hypothetical protein
MNPGNQVTAGGLVLAAGEGHALWLPDTLTVTNAGPGPRATPPAGQPAALRRPPHAGRDYHGEQARAKRGRACPPMSQRRCAAVPGRRWP